MFRSVLAAAAALLANAVLAGPADLDAEFGIVAFRVGTSFDLVKQVLVQPDGKTVAAGQTGMGDSSEAAVVRYMPDGAMDTAFGQGGVVRFADSRVVNALARLSDGTLLVGGPCAFMIAPQSTCIARFSGDGVADPTFGSDGVARVNVTDAQMAVRPDGSIVVASNTGGLKVYLLTSEGAPDMTFGANGVASQSLSVDQVSAALAQADNGIVVAGRRGTDFYAARFSAKGEVDAGFGFGGSGMATIPIGTTATEAYAGLLQADGRVVVAGCTGSTRRMSFARFDTTGQPDAGFGSGGAIHHQQGNEYSCATSLAQQADGRLLAAGDSQGRLVVLRLQSDGSLDGTFATGGRGFLQFPTGGQVVAGSGGASAVAAQGDGRVIVATTSYYQDFNGLQGDFGLARVLADGSLDATFDGEGYVVTELWSGHPSSVLGLRAAPGGRIVALTRGQGVHEIIRRMPDGTADASFGGRGHVTLAGPLTQTPGGGVRALLETLEAIAVQPDGKILVAGHGHQPQNSSTVAGAIVARYNVDGTPDTDFGNGGHVLIAPRVYEYDESLATALEVLGDGRIVIAGSADGQTSFIARLLPTGVVDTSFATNGAFFFNMQATSGSDSMRMVRMALQADGKAVLATGNGNRDLLVARITASGTLDTSFGFGGRLSTRAHHPPGNVTFSPCSAVPTQLLVQPDGRVVVFSVHVEPNDGCSFRFTQHRSVTLIRLDGAGAIDSGFGQSGLSYPAIAADFTGRSAQLDAAGNILVSGRKAGASGPPFVARLTANGLLDPAFGTGGVKDIAELTGWSVADVLVRSDNRIVGIADGATAAQTLALFRLGEGAAVSLTVVRSGSGSGTVTSSPAGIDCGATCSTTIPAATSIDLMATAASGSVFAGWSGGGCSGTGTCTVTAAAATSVNALFMLAAPNAMGVATPGSLEFGGQSMRTSTLPQPVTLTNVGGTTLTVGTIATSSGAFGQTSDCGESLAPGASCVIQVRFTPQFEGAATGTLVLPTGSSVIPLPLSGTGERSLATHYYRAILGRAPDPAGKDFWESEAARLSALGVNINETWFVMAGYFFNSVEYTSANKNATLFVTDLYNTFFNRPPDPSGLGYWVGQIDAGLPREVVLFSFLFSNEFRTFTQSIFGNTAARPEVDMVVDLFRGLLNRLPDTPSFNYWLGRLQQAQCTDGGQVYSMVDEISAAFMFNPEYTNRGRSNSQFVTDMYYSFLRRGGDIEGVQYWIDQLVGGAHRNDIRYYGFLNSPEFGTRVQTVIAAGCAQ